MNAYVPGAQPPAEQKVIKLNTNENPYPPSPAVMEVLCEFDAEPLRRYPDPMAREFCQAAAEVLGVDPEWVIPGNGSDDILMMISRACLEPGKRAVFGVPTFEFYETQANIENAECVPLAADPDELADRLAERNGDVTFLASPNSPTGVLTPTAVLDELAARLDGLLVIDEAYTDFADENALSLVEKHENVIVLRTLSKGYSLAGLRLGFGVAQPPVLEGLIKTKAIYNVGAIACAAGAAAMRDQAHKNANAERVKASRSALSKQLGEMGFTFPQSQANFLLARPPAGNAAEIHEALKARGILVRYFQSELLKDKLRITVGTEDQNAALIDALGQILTNSP